MLKMTPVRVAILFVLVRFALQFCFNLDLNLNNDEIRSYLVAEHIVAGRGHLGHDVLRGYPVPTLFFNPYTTYAYVALIRLGIDKSMWALFWMVVTAVLHGRSVLTFKRLADITLPERWATGAMWAYAVFPSVLFYIGARTLYENIVMAVLLELCWLLHRWARQRVSARELGYVTLMVPVAIMLRPTAMAFFLAVGATGAVWLASKHATLRSAAMLPAAVVTLFFAHAAKKANTYVFGVPLLTTQTGFEFLQGHNPTARGSWMGVWWDPQNPNHRYVHARLPGVEAMNEYEEGRAREALAWEWIKANPWDEVKLDLRKLAIWLWPTNYEGLYGSEKPDPLKALAFVLGLGMFAYLLWTRKGTLFDLVLFAPVLASLAVTIVFFMGARWRFYAEPLLLLYAVRAAHLWWGRRRITRSR